MWEMEIGVFPVTWPGQVDEWAFHLASAIHGQDHQWMHGLPGEGSPAAREVTFRPPPGSSMRCSLRVRPDPGGIACAVFDEPGPGSEDDAELWRAAAESAVALIGKSDQDFGWRAILGPHPRAPEWRAPAPLAPMDRPRAW